MVFAGVDAGAKMLVELTDSAADAVHKKNASMSKNKSARGRNLLAAPGQVSAV